MGMSVCKHPAIRLKETLVKMIYPGNLLRYISLLDLEKFYEMWFLSTTGTVLQTPPDKYIQTMDIFTSSTFRPKAQRELS